MDSDPNLKKNLPRLNREAYQGLAVVHWVLNIESKKTGWLDDEFYARFQQLDLHTFARFQTLSPCIMLMPDHIHILLMGYSESSDQKLAIPFLRKHVKSELAPDYKFQKTPYDHVLRKEERKQKDFANMANYIHKNPSRSGLVAEGEDDWP